MLKLITRGKFEKEVERAKKRGKDIGELSEIISLLLQKKGASL